MYDYIIHRNNYTFLPEIILFSLHLFNFCFECLTITNLKLRLNHAVKIFLKHCQNMWFLYSVMLVYITMFTSCPFHIHLYEVRGKKGVVNDNVNATAWYNK